MSIEIQNLSFEYGVGKSNRLLAMQDINLTIAVNEFLAVVGPSGCGKTTLLRIMGGLLRQTTGTIHRDGLPYAGHDTGVGVVF